VQEQAPGFAPGQPQPAREQREGSSWQSGQAPQSSCRRSHHPQPAPRRCAVFSLFVRGDCRSYGVTDTALQTLALTVRAADVKRQ